MIQRLDRRLTAAVELNSSVVWVVTRREVRKIHDLTVSGYYLIVCCCEHGDEQ
jgi:hypothetical protein